MRHPVQITCPMVPANGVCQLQKMFELIHTIRHNRIQVETTQLDIAFNIWSYNLLQRSGTKKFETHSASKRKSWQSILSNSSPEVWPIHNLVCQEGGGLASERQQKGTLRVKNIQVEKTRLITVLEGDQDDDYEIEGHIDGDDALIWAMWEIYSCDQNGN